MLTEIRRFAAKLVRGFQECIGELFEEPDVVGVALKIRAKEDSLFLWNKDVNLRYKLGYAVRSYCGCRLC